MGAASILVYSADYPASNEMSPRYVIVPTVIYRGEEIRQDRRGTRTVFHRDKKWVIDLGSGLSLPTNSNENKARKGMDDLGFVLELGPRIIYSIFEGDDDSLLFLLPYRFAIATDFSFTKDIGTRINPEIEYTRILSNHLRLRFSIELNYASEVFNDYIYEVQDKYATADRPDYNAKAGYLGSSISAAAIYRTSRFAVFTGINYNRYDNSANENSPLYKTKEGTGVAIGINYFFHQSDAKGRKAVGVE